MAGWMRLKNFLHAFPIRQNSMQDLIFQGLRAVTSAPATDVVAPEAADSSGTDRPRRRRKSKRKLPRRPTVVRRDVKKMQPLPREEYYKSPKQMKTNLIEFLERRDMHERSKVIDIPFFTTGSIMAVVKSDPYIKRGSTRFVGICIAKKNNKLGSTFLLRNIIDGHGIEMMYETYSPLVQKIEVLKLERRRQSKLYYLRDKMPSEYAVKQSFKPVKYNDNKTVPVYKRKY
ncbi:uncharacterized protein TRIADDRAFT_56974 [Trichoplax adhaerens]|uniref:Large ribosomal subunit protein bL19m n=1 Tax=Trichoplax adhaerens TaxID=10228 RepID=B3RX29_TRIAD|nr:hypothetical protein TRIADDRAFT_56974 [Trichoplax adhaerens]EDV25234.1 hypothetical protein TRIADDRAFT_56974 [Trichoplax adhaerens]|eukprot:XP_002113124.1 hypothetical protein TRIADDRAFT_56974 [Trichoplax adhaerens]